jgi:hypothetical protein
MENKSTLIKVVLGVVAFLVLLFINPLSYNDAGERTVVEQFDGKQFVQYSPGVYYAGFFAKQRVMAADGALDKKLAAYQNVQKYWSEAFAKYQGNMVPYYQSGGSNGGNGGINFMELMGAKAAKDLSLELRNK